MTAELATNELIERLADLFGSAIEPCIENCVVGILGCVRQVLHTTSEAWIALYQSNEGFSLLAYHESPFSNWIQYNSKRVQIAI